MLTDSKQVAHQLNHLIQVCLDGEEGFRQAAETGQRGFAATLAFRALLRGRFQLSRGPKSR